MFRFDCTFSNFNCTKRVQLHTILRPGDGRRAEEDKEDERRLETDVDEHGRTMSGRTEEEDDGEPMYSVDIINVSHG